MKKLFFALIISGAIFIALFVAGNSSSAQEEKNSNTDKSERVKQISVEILRRQFGSRNTGATNDVTVERVEIDDLGMAHTRVRQTFDGIPVWEGEAIVHLKADESLSGITDALKESISVDTKPVLSKQDAARIAKDLYKGTAQQSGRQTIDLWIYRGKNRDHLAYRVETPRLDPSNGSAIPIDFIDAQTGERVFNYDNLQTGTGASLYSGTVSIGTTFSGGSFYMENLTRRIGTFNANNGTSPATSFYFADADDIWNASVQRAAVDAHYGADATLNYYQSVHGRNGIDGLGGPTFIAAATNSSVGLISSFVHWGSTNPDDVNNAGWVSLSTGERYMKYGDGDGSTFSPLTTLDICGHEFTHGVTQYTANLVYANESGALNESMSDVFGTMIERYVRPTTWNWKAGEDAYTPFISGDALRYLNTPHLASNRGYTADDDPDHYSERYLGSADFGGVHINSGIPNHVFYLVAQGGTHHLSGVTVNGIGPDSAARIWYRALSFYMTSGTNFSGARTATLNAAADLFGSSSSQYNAVANGWCAVGIGSCAISSCSVIPIIINVGQTVNGTLQSGDCVLPSDGSYYDAFTFNGTAGQQIYISMSSIQFNTYLFLVQGAYPGGTVIAQDENGGGGTNSRIPASSGFLTLPATGTYTILANSSTSGMTGTYSLTLGTTCAYSLNPTSVNVSSASTNGSVSVTTASGCAWTAASNNTSWLTLTGATSGTLSGTVTYAVAANTGAARTGTMTIAGQTVTVNQAAPTQPTAIGKHFDFDGDRKTDIGIFRPSNGQWWHLRSSDSASRAVQFGTSTDVRVPADYTGDGKVDIAFWRPSTGQWFIIRSEDGSFYAFPFGANGDIPAPGDFDRDGRADAAVYRPSNGGWYILLATGGTIAQQFGIAEDKPVVADYDGDGKDDIAVFRPSSAQWWISKSSGGVLSAQFGAAGDKTVQGDYTGDGKADIAFWRPSNGNWYILRSENFSFYGFPFGTNGDVPAPGDYDGDGKFDPSVFRPSNSAFYMQRSLSGFIAVSFGTSGDQPIAASFVR